MQDKKRGRVGKAQITGIGIVGWPASGHPFGIRKSINPDPNKSEKETQEMSLSKKLAESFSFLAKSLSEQDEAESGDQEQQEDAATTGADDSADLTAVVKSLETRLTAVEKGIETSDKKVGELENSLKKSVEVLSEVCKSLDSDETKKTLKSLNTQVSDMNAAIQKMNNYVPSGQDLGNGDGDDPAEESSDEDDVKRLYGKTVFGTMLKKLKG